MSSRFIRGAIVGLACLAGAAFAVPAALAAPKADSVAAAAEAGRSLTVPELFSLYANRTWIWKDGAGFFNASKRQFTAWTNAGADASYGEGVWFMPGGGRLCFRATWHAASGSAPAATCFAHRTNGKEIYQRRLPDGEWFVFKHDPVRSDDEVRKLRYGDAVATRYERNKREVSGRAPKDACSAKSGLTLLDLLFGC